MCRTICIPVGAARWNLHDHYILTMPYYNCKTLMCGFVDRFDDSNCEGFNPSLGNLGSARSYHSLLGGHCRH